MEFIFLDPLVAVCLFALAVILALAVPPLWRARRNQQLRARPLPDEWRAMAGQAMPLYLKMPAPLRARLDGLIQQFMAEKSFMGCNGLTVTLEMKLAVATPACLLVLNRPGALYEDLFSILMYPDAFIVPEEDHDDSGVVTMHDSVLTGQAWDTQRIILSWKDVQASRHEPRDGYNVVLHEFAHYLDAEDGDVNGAPRLASGDAYERWSAIMSREYEALGLAADRGEQTLIDPYGAEDPAEFFAVVTETFFELPVRMKAQHPALYQQLAAYYRLDPANWIEGLLTLPSPSATGEDAEGITSA